MSTATTDATVEATEVPTEVAEPTPATEATHAGTDGEVTEATLVEVPLEQLRTNPLNLRRRVGVIKALTKSIAELGIVVALIVTPADDGTYLLAAGERRLTAVISSCAEGARPPTCISVSWTTVRDDDSADRLAVDYPAGSLLRGVI